jgi:PAS domain S-box-containing protein
MKTGTNKLLYLELIVTNISSRFVNIEKEQLDAEIELALEEISLFAATDRAYVFLYNHEKDEITNTHKWCAKSARKEFTHLKNLPKSLFPWWNKKIAHNKVINLFSLEDLPADTPVEKKALESQGIVSLLIIPIFYAGKPVGFMGFDSVSRNIKWNEPEVKMLRFVADVFGNALKEIELNEQICGYNQELEKLIETRTRVKDEISDLSNSVFNAVFNKKEKIKQFTGIVTDLQNFKLLFDTIDDMVFVTNVQGTFLECNQQAQQKLGYTWEELKRMNILQLHPPERKKEAAYILQEISAGRQSFCPLPLYDKNGKLIPVETKVVKGEWNGNEALFGISRDITQRLKFDDQRKKKENSLIEALQKERKLNEYKTQFVSMASHEFRTPLATMLMAVGTLKAYWKRMSDEEIMQKIDRLESNIQFLKNIIEKTLNLSRLEYGKIKFDPVEEDLNSFIPSVIEKMNVAFNKSHHLTYKGTPRPGFLKIDKLMINEVISNLITNSIKYSNPGTEIKLSLHENKKGFTIEITDSGIGIPEDAQKKIFDAFWRGSNVGDIHGTGLGLALSQKFVQIHGGEITFKSKVDEGTSFFVFLPKPAKTQ